MARHGSERSLHSSQSMHPGSSVRLNTNELPTTELAPSEPVTCSDNSSTIKVNADNNVVYTTGSAPITVPSTSISSSVSSSLDSRIPRPSPTGLRRSASMRMCNERLSPNNPSPLPSTTATTALSRSYHYYRRFNLLHQQHHHLDHRTFPVITENGTESPRQRSLVSINMFNINHIYFYYCSYLKDVASQFSPQYYVVFFDADHRCVLTIVSY